MTPEYVEKRWRRRPYDLRALFKMLDQLPSEQAVEFMWRHRVELRRLRMERFGQHSRSGAFEWERAWRLAIVLENQGLIDTIKMRDQRTGRLVRTIIRELARLDSLWGAERAADLYERMHVLPLPEVKELIRGIVNDSRSTRTATLLPS